MSLLRLDSVFSSFSARISAARPTPNARAGAAVLLLGRTMMVVGEEVELKGRGGGGGGGGVGGSDGGSGSEEELALLPRHTKVVVTGNNRTKSVLVGLRGVVKKAVGLGGWHWLVLTNGIEVKLQRNALSVIEAPSGNEEDNLLGFESGPENMSDFASDDAHKSPRVRNRVRKSSGSSHRTISSRSLSCDSQSKGSTAFPQRSQKVDLRKLETAALWRYWRHFNLVGAIPSPSKEELIDVVQRHFMAQQMDEVQVIAGFIKAARRMKNSRKFWNRSRLH